MISDYRERVAPPSVYVVLAQYNFVGRLLGPRGMTAKQLEKELDCKLMVRGRGSMRDKAKVLVCTSTSTPTPARHTLPTTSSAPRLLFSSRSRSRSTHVLLSSSRARAPARRFVRICAHTLYYCCTLATRTTPVSQSAAPQVSFFFRLQTSCQLNGAQPLCFVFAERTLIIRQYSTHSDI